MKRREIIELQAEEILFNEGDPGDKAYLIKKGCIEIFKDVDGKRIVENKLEQGQIFGELSIIKHASRSAGARAVRPSELLVIDKVMIGKSMQKTPDLIRGTINQLVVRLRDKEEKTDSIAIQENKDESVKFLSSKLQRIEDKVNKYIVKRKKVPEDQVEIIDLLMNACKIGLGKD